MARNAHELRDATGDRDRLLAELQNLHARLEQAPDDAGLVTRISDLNVAVSRADDRITDLEAEIGREAAHERIRELAAAGSVESEETANAAREAARVTPTTRTDSVRDAALRALESLDLDNRAASRLEDLIEHDQFGHERRYITAVSSPEYASAFWKRLSRRDQAVFAFEPAEAEAVRAVERVTQERALATGTTTAGGFAVPAALDPSLINSNSGVINPLRDLATVSTITSNVWNGVSSDGVVASFGAEASESSDASPTLAQPSIQPEIAKAFIPLSFEIFDDWGSIREELGGMFADAKARLEADRYTWGSGHSAHEPNGFVTTGSTANVVTSASTVLAIADVYSLQESLAPRFQPRARWLSNNSVANKTYRLVGPGNTTEPVLFDTSRSSILGKPWNELSTMSNAASGSTIVAYGDFSAGFRIVDRVGLSVELVQNLVGTTYNYPTGQRGLLAWWRTSSAIVNPSAIKLLKIHT